MSIERGVGTDNVREGASGEQGRERGNLQSKGLERITQQKGNNSLCVEEREEREN